MGKLSPRSSPEQFSGQPSKDRSSRRKEAHSTIPGKDEPPYVGGYGTEAGTNLLPCTVAGFPLLV